MKKYQHFKNKKFYELVGTARHSETLEELVVYKALYETDKFEFGQLWARPKKMFFEKVLHNGETVARFQEVIQE